MDQDRILVKSQGATLNSNISTLDISNGIYIYNNPPGSLTRAEDCVVGDIVTNQLTFITDGSLNRMTAFVQDVSGAIVGTNNIRYVPFYSLNYSLGQGLELVGGAILQVKPNLNFLTDVSINNYLDVVGKLLARQDVSMNGKLFVNDDVSMNKNLSIGGDVSMNGNITQTNDKTIVQFGNIGSNTFRDTSFNGNITQVNDKTIVQFGTTGTNLLKKTTFNGNIIQQGDEFIINQSGTGANIFKDTSFNGNITQANDKTIVQIGTTGTNLLRDTSFNGVCTFNKSTTFIGNEAHNPPTILQNYDGTRNITSYIDLGAGDYNDIIKDHDNAIVSYSNYLDPSAVLVLTTSLGSTGEGGNGVRISWDGVLVKANDLNYHSVQSRGQYFVGDCCFNSNVDVSGTLNNMTFSRGFNDNSLSLVIGSDANKTFIATDNMLIGWKAGEKLTTGSNNMLIGVHPGKNITSGFNNIMIGRDIYYDSSSSLSSENVVIGNLAGYYTSGNGNTFLGNYSGRKYDGSSNTFIGVNAGNYGSTTYTGGFGNTLLGADTAVKADNITRSTVIGYGAEVDTNSTIVLGTASETTKIPGKLQVTDRIEVYKNIKFTQEYSTSAVSSSDFLNVRQRIYNTTGQLSITQYLPTVDSTNVGIEIYVVNIDTNLTRYVYINASSPQRINGIYNVIDIPPCTSMIFTSIQTSSTNYGWAFY